jgi:hypothetical protein
MMAMNGALEKFSKGQSKLTQDMNKTAFALLHSSGAYGKKHSNSWDFLENDGEGNRRGWRQHQFVEFMRYTKDIFHLEEVVLNAYDWETAGKATVVDVSSER